MAGGFCTLCSFCVESFDGLDRCPNCGHTGTPCGDERQVTVTVNVHELRVLCIWAENWAHKHKGSGERNADTMPDLVYAIAARLRKQLGEHKATPLTMSDEFAAVKAGGFEYETNHPADEGNNPIRETS